MKERPISFGSHGGLVGVACEPDGGPAPGAPGFLFFNIGLNHRVGPQRVQVELARALAGIGIPSLRFDLSGLGDSEPRAEVQSEEERVVLDMKEAMDALQKRCGTSAFVLVGLCSGTDGVYAASRQDPRVQGGLYIDGYAYADAGYAMRQRLERLRDVLNLRRWQRFIGRRWRLLTGRAVERDVETGGAEPIFDRTYPTRDEFRSALDAFLGRGMELLFVYTGQAYFLDRRSQFASMLGWKALPERIGVEYWPECDHLFTTARMRRKLVDRVVDWTRTRLLPAAPAGPGATP